MAVLIDEHEGVTVVTLNRPEAGNSLDPDTMAELGEAFVAAEHDPAVRVVILAAAGDRIFCGGMDLKAFAAGMTLDPSRPGLEVFTRRVYPKPTIAAVNGAAVAGGFELVLACDMVVAAEHARFGIPEAKRGLLAGGGGTHLPRRLPMALALELGLTGDLIDAPRALALGLVNRVVPSAGVLDEALALAARIAANAPLALTATKQLMYEALGPPDWERIGEQFRPIAASQDAREGAIAFAEKRAARWTGR